MHFSPNAFTTQLEKLLTPLGFQCQILTENFSSREWNTFMAKSQDEIFEINRNN